MANIHLQLAETESDARNMFRIVAQLVKGLNIEKSQYAIHIRYTSNITHA